MWRGVLCSAAVNEGKQEARIILQSGGGHREFWLFLVRFFGFCAKKKSVVRFYYSFRFASSSLAFGFRVSSKIQTCFRNFLSQTAANAKWLRGIRDKPNFTEITSLWWNIVEIHGRSRFSNSTRDFDLAMWSTEVDQCVNYGFQRPHAPATEEAQGT